MKPSLEQWLASRPVCPDCGEKLHRLGFCPGANNPSSEQSSTNGQLPKVPLPSKQD